MLLSNTNSNTSNKTNILARLIILMGRPTDETCNRILLTDLLSCALHACSVGMGSRVSVVDEVR